MASDPTPYYEDEVVALYHGDCREVTAWLAADVMITDPPYGRDWRQGQLLDTNSHGSAGRAGIEGDGSTATRDEALARWGVTKPAVVFGDLMLPPPTGVRQVLVYGKPPDAGVRGACAGFRRDAEAIYLLNPWPTALGGSSSILATSAPSIVGLVATRYRKDRGTGHPHTKPQDVMARLVQATRGTVADPFAGSGSTLVAAKQLGRKAVGVELEERYCEVAARRLQQGVLDFGGAA